MQNSTFQVNSTPEIGVLIVDNNGIATPDDSTAMRSMGTGTISDVGALSFTDSLANFPLSDPNAGKIGLTGLWVQPDTVFSTYYRIVDNDSTTITIDDRDNQFSTTANLDDPYRGVALLQSVFVRNNAKVSSSDPLLLKDGQLFEIDGGVWNGSIEEPETPTNYDLDADGAFNANEIAKGTNLFDPDSDNDGLLDGGEDDLGTDPLDADTDNDGLNDGREQQLGTNPLDRDTDGDGILDGDEEGLSTDPLNADTDSDGVNDNEDVRPLDALAGRSLEINTTAGGTVIPNGLTYVKDGDVTIQAIPDPGFAFVEWSGNIETVADVNSASTTLNASSNFVINANFVRPDLPDLQVTGVQISSNLVIGVTYPVFATIENIGNKDATNIQVSASVNGIPLPAQPSTIDIGAGDSTTLSWEWDTTSYTDSTGEPVNVEVTIDSEESIMEIREDNNSKIEQTVISIISDGLVAYYQFEDNTLDSSGNNNDGTVLGNTGYTSGQINKTFDFNGSNAISINSAPLNGQSEYTIQFWIDPIGTSDGTIVYSEGNPEVTYKIEKANNNSITVASWSIDTPGNWEGFTTPPDLLASNQWTLISVVRASDGTVSVFKNAFLFSTGTLPIENHLDTNRSILGGNIGGFFGGGQAHGYFDGKLDDVRVYNRDLDNNEIAALYNFYKPDLTISELQVPAIPMNGETFLVSSVIENTGYANVTNSIVKLTANGVEIPYVGLPVTIHSGNSANVSWDWDTSLYDYAINDTVQFDIIIDPDDQIPEIDESNNSSTKSTIIVTSHDLTVNARPNGSTEPSGKTMHLSGTTISIEAIPEAGYEFSEWTGDLSSLDNPLTTTINQDVDITAHFLPGARTLFVNSDYDSLTPDWQVIRFAAVQDAIDSASDNFLIIVYPGMYNEHIDFSGKSITLQSSNPDDPTTVDSTMIVGQNEMSPVVAFTTDEKSDAELVGFSIHAESAAIAIQCTASSPIIEFNRVLGSAGFTTLIELSDGASPTIHSNTMTKGAFAINGLDSSPSIMANKITANSGDASGHGVVFLTNCNSFIADNHINNNNGAGGLTIARGDSTIVNNVISANSGSKTGGIELIEVSPLIINNTIVDNNGDIGGGIYGVNSSPTIANCILWGNTIDGFANELDSGLRNSLCGLQYS